MKDLFRDRLQKVEKLADRRLLKNILDGVFQHLADYSEQQLKELEQRVFEEIAMPEKNLTIYSTLTNLDDYDPINDFFYPVLPSDLQQTAVAAQSLQPTLGKFYLELDYLQLKNVHEKIKKRAFKGTLVTNLQTYPIEVKLQPYQGYIQQIEMLYELFLKNDLAWRTILHPYLYKFLEINLITQLSFNENEQVKEFIIDFEELEPYKKMNQIPLWNIQYLAVPRSGFPETAKDHIYYEHVVHLESYGIDHGYLLDTNQDEIHYVYRRHSEVIVVSPKERVSHWGVYQIKQLNEEMKQTLTIKTTLSNASTPSFTDQFARRENQVIRSLGEMARFIHLYPATAELKLMDVQIHLRGAENNETYALNSFLKDQIREEEDKKILQLSFDAKGQNELTRDKMSFLVAEIGRRFPEYICVGELI